MARRSKLFGALQGHIGEYRKPMTTKNDDRRNDPILRPGTAISPVKRGEYIVHGMVTDALDVAHRNDAAKARFHIGDVELRGPDYRQVLRWADALQLKPEDVLHMLDFVGGRLMFDSQWAPVYPYRTREFAARYPTFSPYLQIEAGVIRSLVWDADRLPIKEFEWEPGLGLHTLIILQRMPGWKRAGPQPPLQALFVAFLNIANTSRLDLPTLPHLTQLDCRMNDLTELDLSGLPNLVTLDCELNRLTGLDLSGVPNLRRLSCEANDLAALDLRPVPNLTTLNCPSNRISGLDLSAVPALTTLDCQNNELAEIDLSPAPNLVALYCQGNRLDELNLSAVPGLTTLECGDNCDLHRLDLSPTPNLTTLDCKGDSLGTLELVLAGPNLTTLDCSGSGLSALDLSHVPQLAQLDCEDNNLCALDLSAVPNLTALNCVGCQLSELDLSSTPKLSELRCEENPLTTLDLRPLDNPNARVTCDENVRIIR